MSGSCLSRCLLEVSWFKDTWLLAGMVELLQTVLVVELNMAGSWDLMADILDYLYTTRHQVIRIICYTFLQITNI